MDNPVQNVMARKGLDTRDVAMLIGADVAVVYRVLSGRAGTIPPRMLSAFAEIGVDTDEMARQYGEYRKQVARDLVARLTGKTGRDDGSKATYDREVAK